MPPRRTKAKAVRAKALQLKKAPKAPKNSKKTPELAPSARVTIKLSTKSSQKTGDIATSIPNSGPEVVGTEGVDVVPNDSEDTPVVDIHIKLCITFLITNLVGHLETCNSSSCKSTKIASYSR
jgi:hypothetical protein